MKNICSGVENGHEITKLIDISEQHSIDKISNFLTPLKFRGEWAKYQSEFQEDDLRSNLWHTFDGSFLGRLRD